MEILNIHHKEQLQIKYYVKKYLLLLKIQNMTNIKEVLFIWFMIVLKKRPKLVVLNLLLKMKLNKINNYLKNFTNQLLENLKKEK